MYHIGIRVHIFYQKSQEFLNSKPRKVIKGNILDQNPSAKKNKNKKNNPSASKI